MLLLVVVKLRRAVVVEQFLVIFVPYFFGFFGGVSGFSVRSVFFHLDSKKSRNLKSEVAGKERTRKCGKSVATENVQKFEEFLTVSA